MVLELGGIQSTPFIAIVPRSTLSGLIASDKGPIYGLNRTKQWFVDFTVFCI